jgi:regulator of sirC expression with transglutaminase-like and TPR domain
MQPLAELAALMASDNPPLDRALAVLAAVVCPEVEVDRVLADLDDLAGACASSDADALCVELFGAGGQFMPARDDYYSPANSLIDQVLERRTGIPISLAAVAIEVGRRRGIGLVGIGMPGHFLLRAADHPDRFYDTYDGGRRLDPPACQRCFAAVNGPEAALLPVHLAPVGSRTVVGRVLNNLQVAAERSRDLVTAGAVQRVRVLLSGATLN